MYKRINRNEVEIKYDEVRKELIEEYGDKKVFINPPVNSEEKKKMLHDLRQRRETISKNIEKHRLSKSKKILRSEVCAQTPDFVNEFEALKKYHEICPEYFIKPISLVYNDAKRVVDYYMEFASEFNFSDIERRIIKNITSADILNPLKQNLRSAISMIHSKKLVHGDMHEKNILITSNGFKIIDPATNILRKLPDSFGRLAKEDNDQVDKILSIVDKLLKN